MLINVIVIFLNFICLFTNLAHSVYKGLKINMYSDTGLSRRVITGKLESPCGTMKNEYPLFQKYCEKAIGKLTDECIQTFKSAKDEESRVRIMYDTARKIPINLSGQNGKSIEIAQQEKTQGNAFFAKKDYQNALKCYNNGIITCPQDTDAARELLAILVSNRSATYFELEEYKRVFNDIDYVIELGSYPPHLQYKIWLRKAKCYEAMQNIKLSKEAFDEALESLKHSKLDEKTIASKTKEIEQSRSTKTTKPTKLEVVPVLNPEIFTGGKFYIAAHPKITIEQDTYQGRYARANEDIEVGTIILEENPYVSVVDSSHTLTNCQYCLTSVEQPIACSSCAYVIFCSSNCERLAKKSFHSIECCIQQHIFQVGASVNCSMALRMISQKPLKVFKDAQNKLRDYLKDSCKKAVIKKKTYRSDDYDNIFFLCRHESIRKREELIHYACMAIYLMRLLKYANYFGDSSDEILTDDETYIGSLILRHLQILQFNAHEISELKNTEKTDKEHGLFQANYKSVTIGAGVYSTLALFNHSCDPSIVRYNIKNKMIVRAIKHIKAGDIVYENYGPLYMNQCLEERQQELKKNYWFECLCQPCVEMWPSFSEMNENVLRIPCKTDRCPYVFEVHAEDDPFLTCKYCNNTTSLFPYLKGLMVLDQILPEAENLFAMGQLHSALEKFVKALEILYKYSKPPHPEIIKVQQRIRVCIVHLGNKCCKYKPCLQ